MIDSHRTLVVTLVEKIFAAEVSQHARNISQLVDEQGAISGKGVDGFNYLGVSYGRDGKGLSKIISDLSPQLSLRLVPRMEEILRFRKEVEFDRQIITQAIVKLVQPCVDMQAIRDTLPECVVALDAWLGQTYQRTMPPASSIQNSPRDLKLYEKALPRIETYCAMRLLY